MQLPAGSYADLRRFAEGVVERADVSEIVLYGSASTGTWDPDRSDIDVAVIVDGDDRFSSVHHTSYMRMNHYWSESYCCEQERLIQWGTSRMQAYDRRMHVYVGIPADFERLSKDNDGRGSFADAIRQGTRLYTKQNGFLI